MFLQNGDGLVRFNLSGIDILFVVRLTPNQGEEPAGKTGEKFGVGERHPSQDLGIILFGFPEKSGFLVLGGNYWIHE